MGEETDVMPVQLVKIVLFALVLVIAAVALFLWLSSGQKDEYPYNVAQSFESFYGQVQKAYITDMTTYTFLTFAEGDGYNEGIRFIDNSLGIYTGKNCKKNDKCLCLSIPDPSTDGKQKLTNCKKVNFNVNIISNIYESEDINKPPKTINSCIANHMKAVCDTDAVLSKEVSIIEIPVKISKTSDGVEILASNRPLAGTVG
jgi:hypothetical protein